MFPCLQQKQTTTSSSAPLTIQNHKSVGSPRLLSTRMLDSSHELKETIVFRVWIMVPYNSEHQDRVAHYNNEKYVVWLSNNNTNRGCFAPK